MPYNKERKFRTPRWNNQAAAANPGLRGSSSPVTYPSFARVFRAGATRLHFIPAHAGISSTRSVDFIEPRTRRLVTAASAAVLPLWSSLISLRSLGKSKKSSFNALHIPMNGKMSMQAEREVPLLMQRKPVATLNEIHGQARDEIRPLGV